MNRPCSSNLKFVCQGATIMLFVRTVGVDKDL